eukprot:9056123-Alexandrium_andersonii.AAC.1
MAACRQASACLSCARASSFRAGTPTGTSGAPAAPVEEGPPCPVFTVSGCSLCQVFAVCPGRSLCPGSSRP